MNYRNTRIYQRALELVHVSHDIIENLPSGYGFLADQLKRASASVVLNFAEGAGKPSSADQRRFFGIARGSVYEVAAAIDVGAELGVIASQPREQVLDLCDHVAAMLTCFAAFVGR
jgi:four helix bundle protein